jgi:hypothetical protein
MGTLRVFACSLRTAGHTLGSIGAQALELLILRAQHEKRCAVDHERGAPVTCDDFRNGCRSRDTHRQHQTRNPDLATAMDSHQPTFVEVMRIVRDNVESQESSVWPFLLAASAVANLRVQ